MSRPEHPDSSTPAWRRSGGRSAAEDCPPPSSARPHSPQTGDALETVRLAEERVYRHAGLRLENLHVLEIGAQQDQRHLRRLSVRNEVVGVDTDTTNDSCFHLGDYLRSLGHSSAMRAVKALSQMMLGVGHTGASSATAVARELGLTPFTPPRLLRMSASNMSFDDATFGFVCSFAAFERIDDPGGALREVVRVLRPGGVAYIRVSPYTAPSGHRGSTQASDERPEPPFWPHLRAELEHTLHPDPRLNRLSLKEWQLLLAHIMPGVELLTEVESHDLSEPLARLRARGELVEHSDDELLTARLVAVWKKRRAATMIAGR